MKPFPKYKVVHDNSVFYKGQITILKIFPVQDYMNSKWSQFNLV